RMIIREHINKKRSNEHSLRIWSAGCAVGPEPYSIAMIAHNILGSRNLQYNVKIYATDFNEELLQIARRGIYEGEILDNVPPDYLINYFDSFGKKAFRVKYNIRRMVDFGYLNLINSNFMWKNLDLIFCRNVLIYLDKDIQEVIMEKFHQCLIPDGYLVLGRTEILHPSLREEKQFVTQSLKHRIYRKSGSATFTPRIKLKKMDQSKRFKCLRCGKIFSQLASLRVHERRDCGKIFRCKACGKKFDSEVRLRVHSKYFHQRGYGNI
ncbi:MAG: CheR family methyltransferase, partial [Candidatus Hermodarchaeota archaeon]